MPSNLKQPKQKNRTALRQANSNYKQLTQNTSRPISIKAK